ncbi:acyl dehydratase [Prauserella sediminis]|uniref:Acyl dehydratase n=1 Tax=Prauserella sediminis TaxID=577680 RepID=A0A839XZQ0_9PSEU|nr:MaoC/PaaZ C-terminal domain-containing protein [Prauserella sediminis]MBB3665195.1 acyl dehydratase [Prauserella sediminis]
MSDRADEGVTGADGAAVADRIGPLSPGMRLPDWHVAKVDGEKMKTTAALLRDPTPIHWDTAALRELGMGDRAINQGPLNMAYVMNMLAGFAGGYERVRRLRVRFRGNVREGDSLRAGGVVTGVRRQRADDRDEILCDCDVELSVVDGDAVLTGTATVALPGKGSGDE